MAGYRIIAVEFVGTVDAPYGGVNLMKVELTDDHVEDISLHDDGPGDRAWITITDDTDKRFEIPMHNIKSATWELAPG